MSETLVSIDLGTTRLKVAAFTPAGELLQHLAIRHKTPATGQRAEQWWQDAAAAIRRLSPAQVAGLSLSGRAGAGVFLDRDGEVVADTWDDRRHGAELARLHAWRQGDGRYLSNYGAALVAKYLWLRAHQSDVAAACRHALYAKDFLLFRLTGAHATDISSGPDAPQWDAALLRDFNLPPDLLPRPLPPWRIAGRLTPSAARQTGVPAGTPVAVGAHDGICANVGAGASRPGHFDGVATVVAKLFNIASPGLAFFGEKDWQQLTLIRVMARQLDMPVRIMGVPTVRAANGLALSSRNNYLTDDERARAALIYRALTATRNAIEAGERNYAGLETRAAAALAENGFDVDYVAVRDADLLTPPDADSTRLRILAAARLGGARLIDNVGAVLQGRTALPVVDAATRETPSDHPNRSRIACDDPVRSQERKSFGCGLGDQKTVERILVDRRQHIHSRRMRAGDSQLGVTVLQQPSTQHPGIDTEVRPPKSALDGDLP